MAASATSILAPDFKATPFWWEGAPRPDLPDRPLPARIDVAVVGAGITGLSAALTLARAGREVAVLEAGDAGAGASSRNAGFVGRTLKHSFGSLLRRMGHHSAVAIYRELQEAFDAVVDVITSERIECNFVRCGRLILAVSQRQLDDLAAECGLRQDHLSEPYKLLSRNDLPGEIATGAFSGGALIPDLGALHPGLYHLGILDRTQDAGAVIHPHSPVSGIRKRAEGDFELTVSGQHIYAQEVVVATNGYTATGPSDWLNRRLVPFDAFMIATESCDESLVRNLLPTDRTYIDCNHNIVYLRRSPDHRRILFGGRTGSRQPSIEAVASQLHAMARRILPGMAEFKVSHGWTGRCAGTFDLFPHVGCQDGVWYAAGYCFAGVPMGTYLGRKLAWRLMKDPRGATIFANRNFPSIPFYRGNAWFVPHLMTTVDWVDAIATRGRPKTVA